MSDPTNDAMTGTPNDDDATTTAEDVEQTGEQSGDPDVEQIDAPADPARAARRDAARYRTELRAVQAERDQLAARVSTFQRAAVEAQAAVRLRDPADLWVAGTDLPDLLDEAGDVDPAKVQSAVDALAAARPHWANVSPSFDGGARTTIPQTPTFGDFLHRGRG